MLKEQSQQPLVVAFSIVNPILILVIFYQSLPVLFWAVFGIKKNILCMCFRDALHDDSILAIVKFLILKTNEN